MCRLRDSGEARGGPVQGCDGVREEVPALFPERTRCYLLSIETLHYYGMQLMAKPEENSGVLYKLGGMIDVHAMSG